MNRLPKLRIFADFRVWGTTGVERPPWALPSTLKLPLTWTWIHFADRPQLRQLTQVPSIEFLEYTQQEVLGTLRFLANQEQTRNLIIRNDSEGPEFGTTPRVGLNIPVLRQILSPNLGAFCWSFWSVLFGNPFFDFRNRSTPGFSNHNLIVMTTG